MNQMIVIGHIALIQRSKKQAFVLDVIKALRDKGYDAIGIFAGECREPDYLPELQQRVKELGLSSQVAFLGRRNDIPDLLKLIDVLMIPSVEGFPLAGLEAAAAGAPVAACDVAGAKEFIMVSGDGYTFVSDNVDSAVEAVERIMNHMKEVRCNGPQFAEKSGMKEYQKKIAELIRKCS